VGTLSSASISRFGKLKPTPKDMGFGEMKKAEKIQLK
jgi:hypothetical protein